MDAIGEIFYYIIAIAAILSISGSKNKGGLFTGAILSILSHKD